MATLKSASRTPIPPAELDLRVSRAGGGGAADERLQVAMNELPRHLPQPHGSDSPGLWRRLLCASQCAGDTANSSQGSGQAAPSSVLGACSSSHPESEPEAGRAPGAQRGDRARPRTPQRRALTSTPAARSSSSRDARGARARPA